MRKMNVIRAAVAPTASLIEPPIDFAEMKEQADRVRKQVTELEVTDVHKYRLLASILVSAKALAKNIVAEFKPWVEKAHKAHKDCLAARDISLDVFENAEADAKQKLALYCAESGSIPECEDVIVSETWKYEIIDRDAIPDEFYSLDEGKIGGLVKSMKGEASRTIPGIRVWSENKIAIRGDR